MVPAKEMREIVYRLFQKGFVHVQEIPRGSERIPARTIYSWNVKIDQARTSLVLDMYKGLYNLHLYRQSVVAQNQFVVDKSNTNWRLTDKERKQLEAFQRTLKHIDASILGLDFSIFSLSEA
eukprot:TRINITY_DN6838_c0_g1_i2.p1 TRINITY_DN6838_c0_g1~~TRINITY_DN6838_c0_g1_i2.p1  ORF type:complete len:122 (-),score=39.64 TRINITY_DN6838_c0_g1_i2:42-407(-)